MENQTQAAQAVTVPAELPELLTLQQASKILKVHPNTLRNWERAGVIPVVRVGPRRDRRFPKHGIHQFLPGAAPAPTNLVGAPLEAAPAEAAVTEPTDEALPEEGTDIPIATVSPGDLEQAAEETPHVIVNVPPKSSTARVLIAVIAVSVVLGATTLLFRQLGYQQSSEPSSFAIRRNPPKTIFSDDFEVYDVGALPRPTWNTIGLWDIESVEGQRVLVGQEAVDNPIGAISHVYTGSSGWKDYKLKFDAKVVSGDQAIYALVDYLDENNYYLVKFSANEVSVSILQEGRERILGSAPHTPTGTNNWTTYTIDLHGNQIDAIVDGERVLGIDDASLTSGKVGFAAKDQVVHVDHVQVVETELDLE